MTHAAPTGRREPHWDVLVDVYANALKELTALEDPRLDGFVRELTSLYGQAILEQHVRDHAAAA